MNRRNLPLLALLVAVLVAVVAVVAHGRPLAATAGKGGLPTTFWDYALTTSIIVGGLFAIGMVVALVVGIPGGKTFTPPPHARSLLALLAVAAFVCIFFFFFQHFHWLHRHGIGEQPPAGGPPVEKPGHRSTPVHFRWEELAVVLALLLAGAAVLVATRRRGRPAPLRFGTAPAAVAAALDASLDDLRADPDLRRAIIAAYARMEAVLGAVGVPRRPAEAPLEYLERALLALDTNHRSVRRLTDLFEWARFSQHEPEPSMRDEAVDALAAVRDELLAPAMVAA